MMIFSFTESRRIVACPVDLSDLITWSQFTPKVLRLHFASFPFESLPTLLRIVDSAWSLD